MTTPLYRPSTLLPPPPRACPVFSSRSEVALESHDDWGRVTSFWTEDIFSDGSLYLLGFETAAQAGSKLTTTEGEENYAVEGGKCVRKTTSDN